MSRIQCRIYKQRCIIKEGRLSTDDYDSNPVKIYSQCCMSENFSRYHTGDQVLSECRNAMHARRTSNKIKAGSQSLHACAEYSLINQECRAAGC